MWHAASARQHSWNCHCWQMQRKRTHTHTDSVSVSVREKEKERKSHWVYSSWEHTHTHIRLHTLVSLATSLKFQRKVNCILMLPTPQQQEQQQREQHEQQHQQLNQLQQQQKPQQICSTSCAHTIKQYSIIYCNNGLRLRVQDVPERANSICLPYSHSPSLFVSISTTDVAGCHVWWNLKHPFI